MSETVLGTQEPTSNTTGAAERIQAGQVEATKANIKVQEVAFSTSSVANTGVTAVEWGIFAEAAGKPGTLLASGAFDWPGKSEAQPPPISSVVESKLGAPWEPGNTVGTKYWFCLLSQGATIHFRRITTGNFTQAKSTSKTKKMEAPSTGWEAVEASKAPFTLWASGTAGSSSQSVTDMLTIAEALTGVESAPRALTDTLAVEEGAAVTQFRSLTDTAAIAEALTRVQSQPRALRSSKASPGYYGASYYGGFAYGVAEAPWLTTPTLTVAEAIRIQENSRSVTETLTVAEALARTQSQPRPVADTLTVAEAISRIQAKARNITDAATIVELIARQQAIARNITDTLTIAEAIQVHQGFTRNLADTIGVSEHLIVDVFILGDITTTITGLYNALTAIEKRAGVATTLVPA